MSQVGAGTDHHPPKAASDLIASLREHGYPVRTQTSLVRNSSAVKVCLNIEAIRESDHDVEDPGSVDQFWFPEEDIIVLDLGGGK